MRSEVDQDIVDSLVSFVKKLNDESRNGSLVVVEGQRDADALKSLGYKGPFFLLCHNERLAHLVREAEKYRKTILLLDFDREGRMLTKKAVLILQEKKTPIDLFFRRKLSSSTKGRVKQIEELNRYKDYVQVIPSTFLHGESSAG